MYPFSLSCYVHGTPGHRLASQLLRHGPRNIQFLVQLGVNRPESNGTNMLWLHNPAGVSHVAAHCRLIRGEARGEACSPLNAGHLAAKRLGAHISIWPMFIGLAPNSRISLYYSAKRKVKNGRGKRGGKKTNLLQHDVARSVGVVPRVPIIGITRWGAGPGWGRLGQITAILSVRSTGDGGIPSPSCSPLRSIWP